MGARSRQATGRGVVSLQVDIIESQCPQRVGSPPSPAFTDAGQVSSPFLTCVGFKWVTLDLEGYRMGSLNEVLFIQRDPEN